MQNFLEKTASKNYNKFFNELSQKEKAEEKLRYTLDFMQKILSSNKGPVFRDFWEAKRLCLDFFKEKLSSHAREIFWNEYLELSNEIRRLKEILNEESSFAQEQIDLAIQAVEKDLENFDQRLGELVEIELPVESKILQKNGPQYIQLQKELTLLNTFAGRLSGFRKELIQTQIRIRHKNRLFLKLSQLGDSVFPKRKEKIEILSALFLEDVEQFLNQYQKHEKGPFFDLKDEIKALQKFAKVLTLNTFAFTQSREKLSHCWDQIKEKEMAHRTKQEKWKESCKEDFNQLVSQIETFQQECNAFKITPSKADEKTNQFLSKMKELQLGRSEIKTLKKRLDEAKKPLEEKEKQEREKQKEEEKKKQKLQKQAHQLLLKKIMEVLHQAEALSLDALVEKWEIFVKEKKDLVLSGVEEIILADRLASIADHVQEKKWRQLLEQAPDELAFALRTLLSERHKERSKLKEALEKHRKIIGGSGLNLEQSMLYQELISNEKIRLDAIEMMIEEIEEKLFDLEE